MLFVWRPSVVTTFNVIGREARSAEAWAVSGPEAGVRLMEQVGVRPRATKRPPRRNVW